MRINKYISDIDITKCHFSVSGQQRGDLRFRGSFSDGTTSGRLEVFMNNEWGTICIDGFTKRSADTACRQLGSFEALSFNEAETLGYVFKL